MGKLGIVLLCSHSQSVMQSVYDTPMERYIQKELAIDRRTGRRGVWERNMEEEREEDEEEETMDDADDDGGDADEGDDHEEGELVEVI